MGGAMAFYEKSKCLVIVDRDNSGYEVALSRPGVRPTPEHVERENVYSVTCESPPHRCTFFPAGETGCKSHLSAHENHKLPQTLRHATLARGRTARWQPAQTFYNQDKYEGFWFLEPVHLFTKITLSPQTRGRRSLGRARATLISGPLRDRSSRRKVLGGGRLDRKTIHDP
jgi:hypothetical protein